MTDPAPQGRSRFSEGLQAALERDLERDSKFYYHRLQVLVLILLPLLMLILGLLLIGYQRHVLTIHTSAGDIRIISHRGPFEIATPIDDFAPLESGGLLRIIRDRLTSDRITPRNYDQAAIALTDQVATLPDAQTSCEFYLNNHFFRLDKNRLATGPHRWTLTPNETLRINLDQLPDPLTP